MSFNNLAVEQWSEAPPILRKQIRDLTPALKKQYTVIDSGIRRWEKEHASLMIGDKEYKDQEAQAILTYSYIYANVPALKIARPMHFDKLHVYNEKGEPIIQLIDYITKGEKVKLFSARFLSADKTFGYDDKPIVIKLYQSRNGNTTTSYEVDIYRRLGNPSPSLSLNCYLWNIPVLAMHPMEPLTSDDNEYEVGIHVLQQFPNLHKFTVHSDLKPDNIMREVGNHKNPQYRLIDFGGCAKDKLHYGFCRRTWSRKWQCQKRGKNIVTTPKYDLIELGHAMCGLKYKREHKSKNFPEMKYRKFTGRLKTYMEYCDKIEDKLLRPNEYGPHYARLIEILQGKNNDSDDSESDSDNDGKNDDNANSDSESDSEPSKKTQIGPYQDTGKSGTNYTKNTKNKHKHSDREKNHNKNKNHHIGKNCECSIHSHRNHRKSQANPSIKSSLQK